MTDATITSVLTINETPEGAGDKDDRIGMVLTNDDGDGLLWYPAPEMREVDIVDAVFLDNQGTEGDQGKIQVWISLLAGATYKEPYVTTKDGEPIECVEFKAKKKNTILALTFLEPGTDEHYLYPNLIFHTSMGPLDPGVSVRRRPD